MVFLTYVQSSLLCKYMAKPALSVMCSECATFSFALVFCLVCDQRLPMVSSTGPRIREVFLFSSHLHLSPVSSSLRLSVEMIAWPRPQLKMTPPPFTLLTEEWFIVASFGVLSALTLCYMIIRATASAPTYE